jgi:hypothetical protein
MQSRKKLSSFQIYIYGVCMKFQNLVFLGFAAAALVACGGGGGSTAPAVAAAAVAADVADKYVGTWSVCVANTASNIKETLVFTKTSATSASYTFKQDTYPNSTCAGAPNPGTYNESGTLIYSGTKAVGADTVDKFDISVVTPSASTNKDIGTVSGTTLKLGNNSAALDANGYPNTFDTVYVYNKQ